MLGELVPQGGGDPIPLLKKKLLVGRRSTDIVLPFANVSSRHCELEMQEGYWLVRDLGSSNGTKVNGVRVRSKWVLPGDELAVAKHRYTMEYDVAADAPPPPPLEEDAEENIMGMSLMEKAGLVRRRPPEGRPPRPSQGASPNGSRPGPETTDDEALEWLKDDDEPGD
jgi:adenylate cyclase